MMTLTHRSLRLTTACLAALALAACAPAGMLPSVTTPAPAGPGQAAARPALPDVDSEQGGDVTLRFRLATPTSAARKLLAAPAAYAPASIEELEVVLLWLDDPDADPVGTPTELKAVSFTQAQIQQGPTLAFKNLKRGRSYRAVARAWATVDSQRTQINDEDQSQISFSVDEHAVMTPAVLGDLPVELLDLPAPDHRAAATLGAAQGTGQAHPAVAGSTVDNAISNVALAFDGTTAKVTWRSSKRSLADYDVVIKNEAGTVVVADATGVELSEGTTVTGVTTHTRTFEMGDAALGTYVASVRLKGRAEHVVGPIALASQVATTTLSISGTTATVGWTGKTSTRYHYDVTLLDAADAVVGSATVRTLPGTALSKAFDLTGKPFGAYKAVVRLQGRTPHEGTATKVYVNAVSAVTIGISGSTATVGWTSASAGAADYDVEIVDAATGNTVVATDDATGTSTGTSHTATFDLTDVAYGTYKAKVYNKGAASAAATSTGTATWANAVASGATLAFEDGFAKVDWTSESGGATDFDVQIVDATSGAVVTNGTSNIESLAVDSRDGTSHTAQLDMEGAATGSYKAKIFIKGSATSVLTNAATYTAPAEPEPGDVTTALLTMYGGRQELRVDFTGTSTATTTYTFKFYQGDPADPATFNAVYHQTSASIAGANPPRYIFTQATDADGTATKQFEFGQTYVVDVYDGATKIARSIKADYLEGLDPITFHCTVDHDLSDGDQSNCDIF